MINAYDFDKTIYDGDSSVDFYLYCLKRNKKILLCLPIQIFGFILYVFGLKDKTYFKEKVFSFLKRIDNIDEYIQDFWNKNDNKIKYWYLEQKAKTDVIISASPEFLLKPLEKKLKIKVIASKVNKKTGKFESLNCHDKEKIKRYEKETKKEKNIKRFYSDSIKSDYPMFEYAEEAYLVKKNERRKINIHDFMNKDNKGLVIGISIFAFMNFLFIVPTLLFLIKININKLYFPLGILFLLIFNYYITKKDKKKTIIIFIISLLLIFFSAFLSAKIIDTSVDGNSYRKITSGMMIEGWNPIKESAEDFNKKQHILPDKLSNYGNKSQWFWLDVYPKSLATFGATIEIFTGRIETGKCYTLLTMIILFFVFNHYISYFLNKRQSTILSLLLAANPVSLCQLRTFYVDAALSNIVLIALCFIFLYFKEPHMKKWYPLLICLCIIYIFNIKFNGILFIGIICLAFWIIVLINDHKKKNYKESKYIFISFALSIILSILIGFSPYITNIYRYHEFLPGITGNSTKATGAITKSTQNMSSVEIFYVNIFSKVGDYWYDEQLPLKIPFTVTKEEIDNYYIHAGNFGTFGAMFSGMFIIMIILGGFIIIKNFKNIIKNNDSKYMLIMAILIYLQCNLAPIGFGGLRYVAHFYILYIFVLGLAIYYTNKMKLKKLKIVSKTMMLLIIIITLINISPYFKIYRDEIRLEKTSRDDLKLLSKNKKNLKIGLSTASSHGLLLNLREYNINLKDYEFVETDQIEKDWKYTLSYQIRYKNDEN